MGQAQNTTMTPSEKRFSRLQLENVRCFEKVEIPLDARLTVLIGENGAGKTTVAEAIASLSYGDEEGLHDFPLRREKSSGSIALFDAGETKPAAVWQYGRKRSTRRRLPENRYVFAYGRYRRVHDPNTWDADDPTLSTSPTLLLDELAHAVTERRTTTLNTPDGRLLRDLSRYLVAIHAGQSSDRNLKIVWDQLQQSLGDLQQGLERIEMVRGKTGHIPIVVRRGVRLGINEGSYLVLTLAIQLRSKQMKKKSAVCVSAFNQGMLLPLTGNAYLSC